MLPLRLSRSIPLLFLVLGLPGLAVEVAGQAAAQDSGRNDGQDDGDSVRTVRARVQPRPGAEEVDIDMPVHAVPVDPPLVAAGEARLAEDALVLGVERDGEAVAFPISTLANFEVLNSRIAELPVAPTW